MYKHYTWVYFVFYIIVKSKTNPSFFFVEVELFSQEFAIINLIYIVDCICSGKCQQCIALYWLQSLKNVQRFSELRYFAEIKPHIQVSILSQIETQIVRCKCLMRSWYSKGQVIRSVNFHWCPLINYPLSSRWQRETWKKTWKRLCLPHRTTLQSGAEMYAGRTES